MAPLANRTIATVGSGVMAEAMIAGLLRGSLVDAGQVIASHPRAERRDHLAREYGIRVVADNVAAINRRDVVLFAIKPQMLGRSGARSARTCAAASSSSRSSPARRRRP